MDLNDRGRTTTFLIVEHSTTIFAPLTGKISISELHQQQRSKEHNLFGCPFAFNQNILLSYDSDYDGFFSLFVFLARFDIFSVLCFPSKLRLRAHQAENIFHNVNVLMNEKQLYFVRKWQICSSTSSRTFCVSWHSLLGIC